MKKIFTLVSLVAASIAGSIVAHAATDVITLDLTKADAPLTFDTTNNSWIGTMDDEETSIESQVFSIKHNSMSDYRMWWGFTASNAADNRHKDNYVTYQYNNMARGGIVLDETGAVKKSATGAIETSASVPYLVAYAYAGMAKKPAVIAFNDGSAHELVGCYVNLNSYVFYSVLYGDAFARQFDEGDSLTLNIYGVAADKTEKVLPVTLASFANGNLTAARGWQWVDLSSLGEVKEIYFKLESTDGGAGVKMNTPAYFCLDKLMVKPAANSSTAAITTPELTYDNDSASVNGPTGRLMGLYALDGHLITTSLDGHISLEGLSNGIYIASCDGQTLKIVKK